MMKRLVFAMVIFWAGALVAETTPATQAFEVATVKPVESNAKTGRFITMQGDNRFVVKYYTLKLMIAAAYDLSPKVISGGPAWIESDHYDIVALTPGEKRPARDEQMAMLRSLLADRFKLSFHREEKTYAIYELDVAKSGPKLKASAEAPSDPAQLISTVYPDHLHLPARNATMGEFASLLQRAVLDRPVVDKTGLGGRYDFDLDWTADETQFGGEIPAASPDTQSPPFFTAIEQQLGLRLEAKRGPVEALIVDSAQQPTAD